MESHDIITRILQKMEISRFTAGNIHLVDVTHIINPKNFYVRLASIGEDVKVLEVRGDPIVAKEVYIGRQVIYKSKMLHKYVRGIVIFVTKETTYNIFAIDYGYCDISIPLNDIYLTESNIQCPALAISCQLFLCDPLGSTFSDNAIGAMHNLVGNSTAKINIMSISYDQKLTVDLITEDCPGGVAQLLAMLNYTSLSCVPNMVSKLSVNGHNTVNKYKYKKLQVGDCLAVQVLSGENMSNFYVAEINEYKKYLSSRAEFKIYCRQQKNVTDVARAAIDKRSCGAQVRFDYERAVVLKVTNLEKALVKLIDIGKEVETSFDSIKEVTSKYHTDRNACAIYCSSSVNQIWDNGLPKFLFPGYQLMIEIVEVGHKEGVPHKVNIFPMI